MASETDLWVGAAALKLLEGPQVKMVPFKAALFPPGTLYRLWELAQESHALPYIFWTDQDTPAPYRPAYGSSLKYFLDYFETKVVLVVFQREPPTLLGLIWFQHIIRHYKGDIGIFLRRKVSPRVAQEAAHLALDFAFQGLGWRAVYAVTPWRHARNLCLAVGAQLVATVPGYHYERERSRPVYVLRALAPGQEE